MEGEVDEDLNELIAIGQDEGFGLIEIEFNGNGTAREAFEKDRAVANGGIEAEPVGFGGAFLAEGEQLAGDGAGVEGRGFEFAECGRSRLSGGVVLKARGAAENQVEEFVELFGDAAGQAPRSPAGLLVSARARAGSRVVTRRRPRTRRL